MEFLSISSLCASSPYTLKHTQYTPQNSGFRLPISLNFLLLSQHEIVNFTTCFHYPASGCKLSCVILPVITTTVNALVENSKTSVFKPDSLVLCCSDSGKDLFQQTGYLRLKQKLLPPLLIFFTSSFTLHIEKFSLPVLILLTFLCQCVQAPLSISQPCRLSGEGTSLLCSTTAQAMHH